MKTRFYNSEQKKRVFCDDCVYIYLQSHLSLINYRRHKASKKPLSVIVNQQGDLSSGSSFSILPEKDLFHHKTQILKSNA